MPRGGAGAQQSQYRSSIPPADCLAFAASIKRRGFFPAAPPRGIEGRAADAVRPPYMRHSPLANR
jgi:hypothetical protein